MGHVVSFSVPKEDVAWVERFLQEQKNKGVDKSKVVMTALRRYAETVVHIEDKGSLEEQVEERTEEQRIDIEEQLQRKEEDPSDHKKHIPVNLYRLSIPELIEHHKKRSDSCEGCKKEVERLERLLENNAAKNPEEEQEKEVEEGQENDVQQKDTAKANIFDDQFS